MKTIRGLFLAALAGAVCLLLLGGCGRMGCDRTDRRASGGGLRPPEWSFDGKRIVLSDSGAPLTGPVLDVSWAAVVDADSRQTAWLDFPKPDEMALRETEPGRRWLSEGSVRGPGPEVSEVLRDNKLLRYNCEIAVEDERSLVVTYTADVLQHVVLASFSSFTIRLPLSPYAGARVMVDESFGGVILEDRPSGPSHPSYWEGPLRSLKIMAKSLTLEVDVGQGGFTWVSFVDARALSDPDTSLIIQLYPTLAGPHEILGNVATKGTSYTATLKFTVGPPPADPVQPAQATPAVAEEPPAALPPAVLAALAGAGWELEPFLAADQAQGESPVSFGQSAKWCSLPLGGPLERWRLDVAGEGHPRPALIAVRGPVEDLRLKVNGRGDCLDGKELVEELGLPADEQGRLAEAIWRHFAESTYSMPLHPTGDLGEFIGSYGYGFSSTLNTMALVRLWGHAGLPARRTYLAGMRGYAIAEAYYDGDWHAFDLADRTFYVDPRNMSVASAEELVSMPDLVRLNCDASGIGPGGVRADETAREKYEGAGITHNAVGISFERLMRTSLRKGEVLLRFFRPMGRWAPSPREPYRYANALLAFAPDFNDPGALEGFSATGNFIVNKGALVPQDPFAPAWVEYRATSPYVIVESTVEIAAPAEILPRIALLLSVDAGATWIPVDLDAASGKADLTPYLVPGPQEAGTAYEKLERRFDYRLHIELSPAAGGESGGIESLSALTWSQANPALLPELARGVNELETRCASWKPGASVSLGWIEGDVRADPEAAFVGESFAVVGAVANAGREALADLEVRAYAQSLHERVAIGTWRPPQPIEPGASAPFELRCEPIDLDSQFRGTPISALDIALEAAHGGGPGGTRGAPEPWQAGYLLSVPLRHRPDLVLLPALVRLSSTNPQPGQEVQIAALVRNFCPTRELLYMQGTPCPPAGVALYELRGEARVLVQQVTLPEIEPGSVAAAAFKWTAPQSQGPCSLLMVADPDELIHERDEANSVTLIVVVTPAGR